MSEPQFVPAARHGSGIPLVLLHGNSIDHRALLPLDQTLDAAHLWDRIYLDLPGFGTTPALTNTGGLKEIADWVDEKVETLIGDAPFGLLGNSMGGLLAQEIVVRRPEQVVGLALLGTAVYADYAERILPEHTVVERDDEFIRTLSSEDAELFKEFAIFHTREGWNAFQEHILPGIMAADQQAMLILARNYYLDVVGRKDAMNQVPRFGRPSVVISGRQDNIVGFKDQYALLERYSGATMAVLDRTGQQYSLGPARPGKPAVSRLVCKSG